MSRLPPTTGASRWWFMPRSWSPPSPAWPARRWHGALPVVGGDGGVFADLLRRHQFRRLGLQRHVSDELRRASCSAMSRRFRSWTRPCSAICSGPRCCSAAPGWCTPARRWRGAHLAQDVLCSFDRSTRLGAAGQIRPALPARPAASRRWSRGRTRPYARAARSGPSSTTSPRPGPPAELLDEIIGERHLGVVGGDLQAVDFGQRAERRVAGTKKSPSRRGSGAAGGGILTKKRSSACAFSGGASR